MKWQGWSDVFSWNLFKNYFGPDNRETVTSVWTAARMHIING